MHKTSTAKMVITKVYPKKAGEKGVKAVVKMSNDMEALLRVGFDGQLADKVRASVGKCLALVGTFRFKKDVPLPIFEVSGELESRLVFAGRLTRDAELRYSPQGTPYTFFSLAVNYGWGDAKETDFVNCIVFGNDKERNAAVVLAEQGQKGRRMLVTGRLAQNKKNDKVFTNLIVDSFEFLDPLKKQDQEKSQTQDDDQYDDWSDLGTEIDFDDVVPF